MTLSPAAVPNALWRYSVRKHAGAWTIEATAPHEGPTWRAWFGSSHAAVIGVADSLATGMLGPDCGIQWQPIDVGIPPRIAASIGARHSDRRLEWAAIASILDRVDDREWACHA